MRNTNNPVFTVVLWFCFVVVFLTISNVYCREVPIIKGDLRIPDSNHMQIIIMKDGSKLMGRIVEIAEGDVQFETSIGIMSIPMEKIKEIKEVPISSIREGTYWFPNPNATRLYFGPTGRCLKKGEGYFADYYILFPFLSVGVTDNITLSGGVSLIPGLDIDKQLLYIAPKVGIIQNKKFAFSLGAFILKLPSFGDQDTPIIGVLYGVGTIGSPDHCFTTGLGYGFADWELADKPMVMIGGEVRASRRIAFVTENWLIPGADYPLISYGMRFFGESLSVDLAFFNIIGGGMTIFPGIPYIDFVFKF